MSSAESHFQSDVTGNSQDYQTVDLLCDAVHLTLDGKQVLQNIHFSTNARRIGIVGRNGSGKTTLARLVAGLIAPTSGQITVDGQSLSDDRKAALSLVGFLFQNPDRQIIFPTVEEELVFGLRQQGISKSCASEQARAILKQFGKSHWFGAPTHLLSQGQKQLLCLMAVLLMKPRVIILDEPFSGLDISIRLQLQRVFDNLPMQIVQVSHDPDHLQGYDHIFWVEQGRLRLEGAPSEVLPQFEKAMTAWGAMDDLSDLPR